MAEPMSNREIVESFYEAVGEKAIHEVRRVSRGDIDHLRRIFAEDIGWIHPYYGGAFHGANSVIEEVLIPGLESDEWELAIVFHRFMEEGDTIVVLGTYRATYKPTGKPVVEPVAHAWYLKDGQIVRFQQYVDTASIHRQLED